MPDDDTVQGGPFPVGSASSGVMSTSSVGLAYEITPGSPTPQNWVPPGQYLWPPLPTAEEPIVVEPTDTDNIGSDWPQDVPKVTEPLPNPWDQLEI